MFTVKIIKYILKSFIVDRKICDVSDIDYEMVKKISNEEFIKKELLIKEILEYDSSSVDFLAEEERAFPGNKTFFESGYYKTMLSRYFFSGKVFCQNRDVLDTCCGLGWGTYIISRYAKKVIAFDLDKESIIFSKKTWKTKNINWITGDALDLSFLKQDFDVILGMETIEHFSKNDGEKYVEECSKKIKKGGYFIGTSAFPVTREEADNIRKNNQFHLYIFTENEMEKVLKKYFSEYKIINSWMFIAKK